MYSAMKHYETLILNNEVFGVSEPLDAILSLRRHTRLTLTYMFDSPDPDLEIRLQVNSKPQSHNTNLWHTDLWHFLPRKVRKWLGKFSLEITQCESPEHTHSFHQIHTAVDYKYSFYPLAIVKWNHLTSHIAFSTANH